MEPTWTYEHVLKVGNARYVDDRFSYAIAEQELLAYIRDMRVRSYVSLGF